MRETTEKKLSGMPKTIKSQYLFNTVPVSSNNKTTEIKQRPIEGISNNPAMHFSMQLVSNSYASIVSNSYTSTS